MDMVNEGIAKGFYRDAIAIEESILTDRLLLFYRQKATNQKKTNITLGVILCLSKKQ